MAGTKHIIVVGATGGIGSVLAREFVGAGHVVTLSSRTEHKLIELSNTLGKDHTLVVSGDATNLLDVQRLFDSAQKKFGRVDAIIIASGTWDRVAIDDSIVSALGNLDKHYRGLFASTFVVSFIAQQFFRKQGSGLIVNISSHAAVKPQLTGNLTYGPMKAAERHLMLSLHEELKGTDVRVTDLEPAIVYTRDTASLLDTAEKKEGAVQPEDIARWILDNLDNPDIPITHLFESSIVL